jgi:hypothetical protein
MPKGTKNDGSIEAFDDLILHVGPSEATYNEKWKKGYVKLAV